MIYDFEGKTPKLDPNSWVAPNAVVIGNVDLKKDSNIWFNVTLRGDVETITIGEGTNIQDGSVVHTDPGCPTLLGQNVTVGPLVLLHGCVLADDLSLLHLSAPPRRTPLSSAVFFFPPPPSLLDTLYLLHLSKF